MFTAPNELVTISVDGVVERFAPQRDGHEQRTLAERDTRKMVHTSHPRGMLSLNEGGQLTFFGLAEPTLPPLAVSGTNSGAVDGKQADAGIQLWNFELPLSSFAMSDDHETIAVTDQAGDLHILKSWREQSGELRTPEVRIIRTPPSDATQPVGVMSFSKTGRYLATNGNTRQIVVYDLASDSDTPIARRWYENLQTCLAFSPDEQSLFIGGYAGIDVVDLSNGQSRFRLPKENLVRRAAYSPQGERLIACLQDGSLLSLDQTTGATQFRLHGIGVSGAHTDLLQRVRFLSEDRLLTIGSQGDLHFWDLDEQLQLGSFRYRNPNNDRFECQCLDISPSGDELVIGVDCHWSAELHRWQWNKSL